MTRTKGRVYLSVKTKAITVENQRRSVPVPGSVYQSGVYFRGLPDLGLAGFIYTGCPPKMRNNRV